MCLCDQLLIKALYPKTQMGFPGPGDSTPDPMAHCLDIKNVLWVPRWERTLKPVFSLSEFCPMNMFSCWFSPFSFDVLNLTINNKWIWSLMSPHSETTNLKVVWGSLKNSTFKIYEFNSFVPCLLFPLWSKLPLPLIWDNATLILPLLPYSQFSKEQPEWSSKKM